MKMVLVSVAALATLCGCARFQVQVSVLDPDYARPILEADQYRDLIEASELGDTRIVTRQVENLARLRKEMFLEINTAALAQREAAADLDSDEADSAEELDGAKAEKPGESSSGKRDEHAEMGDDFDHTEVELLRQSITDLESQTVQEIANNDLSDVQSRLLFKFLRIACPVHATGAPLQFKANTDSMPEADSVEKPETTSPAGDAESKTTISGQTADHTRVLEVVPTENFCKNPESVRSFGTIQPEQINAAKAYQAAYATELAEIQSEITQRLQRSGIKNPETRIRLQHRNTAEVKLVAKSSYLGQDGATLALSEIAYAAVNAPEDRWAHRFNIAEGIGTGGSTDVVIKLNSTADFSVKGMVFDARATAVATRKLTISAVQLLSAGAGMPIKTDLPTSSETDPQGSPEQKTLDINDQITTLKAELAVSEANDRNRRAALKRIAFSVIESARTAEDIEPEDRPNARKKAEDIYKANRALISAED